MRAYELANVIEERWRQRSRCKWLKSGDKNTIFFHSYASARLRRNSVMEIRAQGMQITDPTLITSVFFSHMKQVLGEKGATIPFQPAVLYRPLQGLSTLQDPFSFEEIHQAVRQLANNKASGPDGLTNEVLKRYWDVMNPEIMALFQNFYNHNLDLKPLNRANIVMIPKKDTCTTVKDYRPISIINLFPKLISKVLANRLRLWLPGLTSNRQTAFVNDRHIAEAFLAAREMITHMSTNKNPSVLLKIDFSKAFDSIEWSFVLKIMQVRGFPNRWLRWIEQLLQTSSSRVLVNGQQSDFFDHKRGLRQGDPLSPMLFIIAVDVLQTMVQAASSTLNNPISSKVSDSIVALQYADDTLIMSEGSTSTIVTLKLVLRLFTKVSGLDINFEKSCYVPFRMSDQQNTVTQAILGCAQEQLPLNYLGMPLTVTKPGCHLYIPLIEKIENRLQGWKRRLISRGGRLQLVRSVLSSIPIYYMTCFLLPNWVIDRIDKLRREFLWGRSNTDRKGISLVNWEIACTPRRWGGLGITNLKWHNRALLLRWWWRLYNNPASLWTEVITVLKQQNNAPRSPIFFNVSGSFFWKQLRKLLPAFHWSTEWVVGNGEEISFWFDAWDISPILIKKFPRPQQYSISIRNACPIIQTLYPDKANILHQILFSDKRDELTWRWEVTGTYSAKSVYQTIMSGGKIKDANYKLWRYKVPETVRIFAFLLFREKILTHDVMIERNIYCNPACVMCQECLFETAAHLLFECRYAWQVWCNVATTLGFRIRPVSGTIQDKWDGTLRQMSYRHKDWAIRAPVLLLCACWHIWRQRNRTIFDGKTIVPVHLAARILQDVKLWLRFC